MSRRSLALLFLALAAACNRRPDAALDRDDVTLHPAAGPTAALLDSAVKAARRGDTAAAHARLADAEAMADDDPALVYSVAAVGDRLGDGPNAAMGYAHYLALAPDGAYAGKAAERRAALLTDESPTAVAAASVPSAPAIATPSSSQAAPRPVPSAPHAIRAGSRPPAMRGARLRTAPVAVRRSSTRAPTPARRAVPRMAAAPTATGAIVTGPASPADVVATTNTGETAAGADTRDSVLAAAPAAPSTHAHRGKLAAIGAATGALVGAVLGRGAPSAVAGAVIGGAAGAAAGSRQLTPTGRSQRTPLAGTVMTSAGW